MLAGAIREGFALAAAVVVAVVAGLVAVHAWRVRERRRGAS
jgi:hypothetical protein